MLRLLLGFPGALTNWGFRLVRDLVEADAISGRVVQANTAEQLEAGAHASDMTDDTIVLSDCPDSALVDFCTSREHRAVLLTDDLRDAATLLLTRNRFTMAESLRFLSGRVGAMWPLFGRATTRRFDRDEVERDPLAAATAIAEQLALKVGRQDLLEILRRDVPGDDCPGGLDEALAQDAANYIGRGAWARCLDDGQKRLAVEVLEPLAGLMRGGDCPRLSWPPPLFLHGDSPRQPLSAAIDLLGPARLLVYGPYLFLPPGHWQAEAEIDLRDGAFRTGLAMDAAQLGQRDPLAMLKVRASRDGPHLIRMNFLVERASEPAEIRISTTEGAIEGSFALRAVRLAQANL